MGISIVAQRHIGAHIFEPKNVRIQVRSQKSECRFDQIAESFLRNLSWRGLIGRRALNVSACGAFGDRAFGRSLGFVVLGAVLSHPSGAQWTQKVHCT